MIKKGQILFEEIVEKVENNQSHFGWFLQLFVALLSIRLTLEFFSNQKLFTLLDIIHIGLWFIFIVVAFLLQLHLFSGENILKISKLVITFFSISLTAPLIDLIVHRGIGVKMNYLSINNWSDFLFSYFTIGGASLRNGATLGIRIEIVLLVIACFNYVRTKRKSIVWGIFAAFSIYTVLFLSGAIPFFLGFLIKGFNLQNTVCGLSTIYLFLVIDFLLLGFALYRYQTNFVKGFSIHWSVISFAIIYFTFGAYQARLLYPDNWVLDASTFFYFPILILLGFCMVFLSNIYENPNFNTIYIKKIGVLLAIFILSIAISYKTLFITILSFAVFFISNEPPFFLNKIKILKYLLNGVLFTTFSLIGFCSFGGVMIGFSALWLLSLFIVATIVSFLFDYLKNKINHV